MNVHDFLPGDEIVARARSEIDSYNRERAAVAGATSRRVKIALGSVGLGFALGVVLIRLVAPQLGFLTGPYLFLSMIACIAGFLAHDIAKDPAKRFQQGLRARMFPIVFGFVDDLSYRNGVTPESYGRLPPGAVGNHNRRSFDDVVSCRYQGFDLELFEASLRNKRGKSNATVFRGIVLAARLPQRFPGTMTAARKAPEFIRLFRDLFAGDGLERITLGHPETDEAYEFRSNNPSAARAVANGDLLKALDWLHDAWPQKPGRLAVSGDEMFLLLPQDKNLFELPHISVKIDYSRHIEPIVADLSVLVATAALMRKAVGERPQFS